MILATGSVSGASGGSSAIDVSEWNGLFTAILMYFDNSWLLVRRSRRTDRSRVGRES